MMPNCVEKTPQPIEDVIRSVVDPHPQLIEMAVSITKDKINMTEYANWTSDNITSEVSRTYHYPNGENYTINNPYVLFRHKIKLSHRVVDNSNRTHAPREGWLAISWEPKDKTKPFDF